MFIYFQNISVRLNFDNILFVILGRVVFIYLQVLKIKIVIFSNEINVPRIQ